MNPSSGNDRVLACLTGAFIGDALAMPVHYYHETDKLKQDYGTVTDFVDPKSPHTDSFMDACSYTPPNKKADILHDQARYWGRKGVHYHQFLKAGENTLNLQLANQVRLGLIENGGYRVDKQLARYMKFMTTPGSHRDTYVDECHKHFFIEYSQGRHPLHCGKVGEKHIGGLVGLIPILAHYHDQPEAGRIAAMQHLHLTHVGDSITHAASFLIDTLNGIASGQPPESVLNAQLETNPLLKAPLRSMQELDDAAVVGGKFKTSGYVEHSIPCVAYLLLKHGGNPERALIANTNLGGDNCHRGAVLGALLGAAHGPSAWPERWVRGLQTRLA